MSSVTKNGRVRKLPTAVGGRGHTFILTLVTALLFWNKGTVILLYFWTLVEHPFFYRIGTTYDGAGHGWKIWRQRDQYNSKRQLGAPQHEASAFGDGDRRHVVGRVFLCVERTFDVFCYF